MINSDTGERESLLNEQFLHYNPKSDPKVRASTCCLRLLTIFIIIAIIAAVAASLWLWVIPRNRDHVPMYMMYNAIIYAGKGAAREANSHHNRKQYEYTYDYNTHTLHTSSSSLSSLSSTDISLIKASQLLDKFEILSCLVVARDGTYYDMGYESAIRPDTDYASIPHIDMNGYVISPGFGDAHGHIMSLGIGLLEPNVRSAKTITEVNAILLAYTKEHKLDPTVDPGYFIMGGRWDQTTWNNDPDYNYDATNHPFPTYEMLDRHFPGLPLVLGRVDGHSLWVNSAAMRLVEIPDKDPDGGKIMRDDNGKPTGIFIDSAMDIFLTVPYAQPTHALTVEAMVRALQLINEKGITMVNDAGLEYSDIQLYASQAIRGRFMDPRRNHSTVEKEAYHDTLNGDKKQDWSQHVLYDPLPIRLYGMVDADQVCGPTDYHCPRPLPFSWIHHKNPPQSQGHDWVDPYSFPSRRGSEDPFLSYLPKSNNSTLIGRFSVNAAKLFSDGALGSWGAYLIEPYSDRPTEHGISKYTSVKLQTIVQRLSEQNMQIGTHAIGDGAVLQVLHAYNNVFNNINNNKLSQERRHRIEHYQIIPPKHAQIMTKWNIIPSMQPIHAIDDRSFALQRLGQKRLDYAYTWAATQDITGILPMGTDFPVSSLDPLENIYAAIHMRGIHTRDEPFLPSHVVERETALWGYTHDTAYAAHSEHNIGQIYPKYMADFIVLSQDILQNKQLKTATTTKLNNNNNIGNNIDIDNDDDDDDDDDDIIEETTVLATFVDGNVVFEHKDVMIVPRQVKNNNNNKLNDDASHLGYTFKTIKEHTADDPKLKKAHWYSIELPHDAAQEVGNTVVIPSDTTLHDKYITIISSKQDIFMKQLHLLCTSLESSNNNNNNNNNTNNNIIIPPSTQLYTINNNNIDISCSDLVQYMKSIVLLSSSSLSPSPSSLYSSSSSSSSSIEQLIRPNTLYANNIIQLLSLWESIQYYTIRDQIKIIIVAYTPISIFNNNNTSSSNIPIYNTFEQFVQSTSIQFDHLYYVDTGSSYWDKVYINKSNKDINSDNNEQEYKMVLKYGQNPLYRAPSASSSSLTSSISSHDNHDTHHHMHNITYAHHTYSNGFRAQLPPCIEHAPLWEYTKRYMAKLPDME